MNTHTGEIYDKETMKRLSSKFRNMPSFMEMIIPPTKEQMSRNPPKVGRNEPCPCNSGKKFKKCCLGIARMTEHPLEKA